MTSRPTLPFMLRRASVASLFKEDFGVGLWGVADAPGRIRTAHSRWEQVKALGERLNGKIWKAIKAELMALAGA